MLAVNPSADELSAAGNFPRPRASSQASKAISGRCRRWPQGPVAQIGLAISTANGGTFIFHRSLVSLHFPIRRSGRHFFNAGPPVVVASCPAAAAAQRDHPSPRIPRRTRPRSPRSCSPMASTAAATETWRPDRAEILHLPEPGRGGRRRSGAPSCGTRALTNTEGRGWLAGRLVGDRWPRPGGAVKIF
jgi:hypothetical protein